MSTFAGCRYSDAAQDVIKPDGTSAGLRSQSVDVFRYLAAHSDRLVTRNELSENIWGNVAVTDDSLTKCISEIRKALNDRDKRVLKTLPRRGYQLVADDSTPLSIESPDHQPAPETRQWWLLAVSTVFCITLILLVWNYKTTDSAVLAQNDGIPRVTIDNGLVEQGLANELNVALARYRTLHLVGVDEADMQLKLQRGTGSNLVVQLINAKDNAILFAESYDEDDLADEKFIPRIAAAIASPGVGAIDNWLLKSTRLIPVDQLSKAACYAYGYGCSKCSGEEDTITRRAEACLAAVLEEDPDDARAWALQATIHAHQYWWANSLPEPMRSDPSMRQHLPAKAIDAANKAESLSDGNDTSVYWGMAEAYFSACEADKLQTVINRGLEINPDDPNLMGAFGNWMAYSGKWEEGAQLTLNALEIEPVRYKKWWWMGPAKASYVKEDYRMAYQYFMKAYNERNWMSHLQLAYTLPHLGRVEEARESVATLQYMYPGFTLEKALEIYDLLCFPDKFLQNIKVALTRAGLPSRGSSDDLANITLPRARVLEVNGTIVEYLDVGTGEPVIFVHGAFNDYRTWGHYMVPVSEKHRFISYSRRYFGTQAWLDDGGQYSVENFARDLIGLIETLDLKGVHLVSWSSGVRTANAAAILRPELIKSITHFEPVEGNFFNGMEMPADLLALEDDWFSRWGPVDENLRLGDEETAVEKMYEIVFQKSPGEYVSEREPIRELIRQNARTLELNFDNFDNDEIKMDCNYLSGVRAPTLVLHGELTHGYWKRMAMRVVECQPNAQLAMIDDANHYAPLQKTDQMVAAVLSFVGRNK